jgi:ATP-dependent Zn protease
VHLDRVVRERLDHAYARARELIRVKAPLVSRLAWQLLANTGMTGDEVAALIRHAGGADPSPTPEHGPGGGWVH